MPYSRQCHECYRISNFPDGGRREGVCSAQQGLTHTDVVAGLAEMGRERATRDKVGGAPDDPFLTASWKER
jgi:hypothetical protein